MLIFDGWINGIVATGCFIFAMILGLGIIIQARKIHAKLLFLIGINIFLTSFFWIITFFDFLIIIFTNQNLILPDYLIGLVTYMLAPFITLISLYIGAELMMPTKKKIVVISILIVSFIFEAVIIFNPIESFIIIYPPVTGTNLITIYLNTDYLLLLVLYSLLSFLGIIYCGFGYLFKSIRSTGVLRGKFLSLSIGYILFLGFPLMWTIILNFGVDIPIYYVRIGMVSSFLFFYFGLKEAPMKKEKKPSKKEIKVEDSLFRLYERPLQISEEEVIFHRDRKICLVCKGDVVRVSYICPKCNALYCINCSEVLSNQENMCWVCSDRFDESKPTRPQKVTYKDIKVFKKKQNDTEI